MVGAKAEAVRGDQAGRGEQLGGIRLAGEQLGSGRQAGERLGATGPRL